MRSAPRTRLDDDRRQLGHLSLRAVRHYLARDPGPTCRLDFATAAINLLGQNPMTLRRVASISVICLVAGFAVCVRAAPGDMPSPIPGCRLDDGPSQALRIYECQERLRLTAEARTRFAAIEQDGRLIGVRITEGAVLVDSPGKFRVVTGDAVTEFRSARVAVDKSGDGTAVLVRDGGASVSRSTQSIVLASGEGIDVPLAPPASRSARPRREPALEAKPWAKERTGRLLARLGQP